MKYGSSNKPLYCPMTQSTWYRKTYTQTPVGVLWHSTGVNNPTVKRYVQPSDNASDRDYWLNIIGKNPYGNDWNHTDQDAGVNFWIGKLADGSVSAVQVAPLNYRPWGCYSGSKGSCNNGWVQFEICEDSLSDKAYFEKVYKEGLEITAYICKTYGIDPYGRSVCGETVVPNITCHSESYSYGCGSNHSDVMHWFNRYGKTMQDVRDDVSALLGSYNPGTETNVYELFVDCPVYPTANDAINMTNSKIQYPKGTYYIYSKYPNGYKGVYNITKDITGGAAGGWVNPSENKKPVEAHTFIAGDLVKIIVGATWYGSSESVPKWVYNLNWYVKEINDTRAVIDKSEDGTHSINSPIDVANLQLVTSASTTPPSTSAELYRVRTSWDDAKSQKGAYSSIENAKKMADENASAGYKVFDSTGKVVYVPEVKQDSGTTEDKPEPSKPPEKPEPSTPSEKPEQVDYNTHTYIVGNYGYSEDVIVKVVKAVEENNEEFDRNIAKTFFSIAPKYGISPLYAIAQSILETGWFKFIGSSVKPEQHNYCGLGATGGGESGASFDTIEKGVEAQLQHLYAYGSKDALPENTELYDPRYSLVTRGKAMTWEELTGKWAVPGYDKKVFSSLEEAIKASTVEDPKTYGHKIINIAQRLTAEEVTKEDIDKFYGRDITEKPEDKPETPNEPTPTRDNLITYILKMLWKFIKSLLGK